MEKKGYNIMHKLSSQLLAIGITLVAPLSAVAQPISLSDISGYLDGMRTAQGDFTQINDDGSITTGTVYIKRPGKVRFEYDAPDAPLVVAGANTVVIYDKKSNQPAQTYPLSRTPLSISLADHVDLNRAKMVSGHSYDGTATTVTAQDPEHPEYGNIQMKFTGNPVEMRQWIINNGSGGSTTVVLGEMTVGGTLPNSLFNTAVARGVNDR
jgi:outer membrane lipoprotein-sorting protein